MSIRLRLTMWYTAILSATLLLFGIGLYGFLHYAVFSSLEKELQSQAEKVSGKLRPHMLQILNDSSLDYELTGVDLVRNPTFFQLVNITTGAKGRSPNLQQANISFPVPGEKELSRIAEKGDAHKVVVNDMSFLVYSMPVYFGSVRGGSILVGVLQSALYIDSYEKLFGVLRLILFTIGSITVLLAASVGWFLARKAFRPIDQVIVATNQIGIGADLDKRIEYSGPNDEIGRLTETINGMLARIQRAYEELEEAYRMQRRFVSDASHELRTPLTTIRGNVDLLQKMWKRARLEAGEHAGSGQQLELSLEAMQDIAGEAERMSRMVNDLLSLARADAGQQIEKTEIEIKPLVEGVVRKAQLLPRSAQWQPDNLDELEGVCVLGSRDHLQQLLFIFIENAFKYTEKGWVKLEALRKDNQVGIRIEDTGIGMDKDEVPHIFDRFYRADPSRGIQAGTGLGLSIAKWIIDEHRGSIEVFTRKGEGSAFIIWLPIAENHVLEAERKQQPFQLPGD